MFLAAWNCRYSILYYFQLLFRVVRYRWYLSKVKLIVEAYSVDYHVIEHVADEGRICNMRNTYVCARDAHGTYLILLLVLVVELFYCRVRTEPRLSLLSVERQPAVVWQPCAAPCISTLLDKYSRLPPPPSPLLLPPTTPTPVMARLPCVHPRVCWRWAVVSLHP